MYSFIFRLKCSFMFRFILSSFLIAYGIFLSIYLSFRFFYSSILELTVIRFILALINCFFRIIVQYKERMPCPRI